MAIVDSVIYMEHGKIKLTIATAKRKNAADKNNIPIKFACFASGDRFVDKSLNIFCVCLFHYYLPKCYLLPAKIQKTLVLHGFVWDVMLSHKNNKEINYCFAL